MGIKGEGLHTARGVPDLDVRGHRHYHRPLQFYVSGGLGRARRS